MQNPGRSRSSTCTSRSAGCTPSRASRRASSARDPRTDRAQRSREDDVDQRRLRLRPAGIWRDRLGREANHELAGPRTGRSRTGADVPERSPVSANDRRPERRSRRARQPVFGAAACGRALTTSLLDWICKPSPLPPRRPSATAWSGALGSLARSLATRSFSYWMSPPQVSMTARPTN